MSMQQMRPVTSTAPARASEIEAALSAARHEEAAATGSGMGVGGVTKRGRVAEESKEDVKSAVSLQTDDEGQQFILLSEKRRATVRTFRGQKLLDIREFYEKDGKMAPGKKGIAMKKEQAEKLRDSLNALLALM